MPRPSRAPIAFVHLLLILVITLTIRLVVHRLGASHLVEHDPGPSVAGTEENAAGLEGTFVQGASALRGEVPGIAPLGENAATPAAQPPADNADAEPTTTVATSARATEPGSAPPMPDGVAITSAPSVTDLVQPSEPTQPAPTPAAPRPSDPMEAVSDAVGLGPRTERRTDLALVRAWARDNGYTVADRGRIAAAVLTAYDHAH